MAAVSLYDKIVRETYPYLGPAADRFVTRQISNHLDKKPEELRPADLPELIDWIKLAMGFLTEDEQVVSDYAKRLGDLGNGGGAKKPAQEPVHANRAD